jgi:c(7)-type cytochrome triheme protein
MPMMPMMPMRPMRPRALVLSILLGLACGVAYGEGARTVAIGFDHTVHARDVEVSGATPIACARCHEERAGRLVGRPGHAACFGTCHGPAPKLAKQPLDADRLKLCTNCHAEASLVPPYTGKLAVAYPPYLVDRDFSLVLGHKQHREIACTKCHDPIAHKVPAPHTRCAGCHDGATSQRFTMASCESCHPPAVGKPQPPELATVQNSVTAVFSHMTHAARGGAGKACATCHAKLRDASENQIELPRPTATECASCHDGTHAFGVTTACTRCHVAPIDKFEVERPEARFRHDTVHAALVASEPCAACHVLDAKTGEVAVAGHAACTQCHASDFGERKPKKCGACHNATEPWRHLRADRALPDRTEFGAMIDHGVHHGACANCHSLQTSTTQLRPPRGHGACSGRGCHAASGGALPTLAECTACHRVGLASDRLAQRIAQPWSVRLAFDHTSHVKTGDGAPLACTSCHTSLVGPVPELATPAKATCAGCHDGGQAFKLTGTTCRRCHAGSVK